MQCIPFTQHTKIGSVVTGEQQEPAFRVKVCTNPNSDRRLPTLNKLRSTVYYFPNYTKIRDNYLNILLTDNGENIT